MFKHLFKLIWNKKKQNMLLMSEILISFLVLFAVFTLLSNFYKNYRKPMGLDYDNVWVVYYHNPLDINDADSLTRYYENVRQSLLNLPEVKKVSFSSENYPFSEYTNAVILNSGSNTNMANNYTVEDSYKDLFHIKLLEGRWFGKQDDATRYKPLVINSTLKESFFGNGDAVGKLITNDGGKTQSMIVGVVEDSKAKGDYQASGTSVFNRIDTASFRWLDEILVRASPEAGPDFESKLNKIMANSMKNANLEIERLSDKRKKINDSTLLPMIILLIVACFLVFNVGLGLFGVLWYNISKRRGEIGLRRAVGATGGSIALQLAGESFILATFSLIIGVFFAIQFPLLNIFDLPAGVYITALVLAIVFIYLLVLICSLYPGKQAAGILPAVALREG
jgi:putative ABC transport system permease protein